MINQAAIKLTLDEDTKDSDLPGSTTENEEPDHKLYEIESNLMLGDENELSSVYSTNDRSDVSKIFPNKIPVTIETRSSFSVLQEWEGYVVHVSDNNFTARLTDITGDRMIEEEADFPLDDLDDADRLRISPGDIFRWVIAYRRSPSGTKDRSSRILLRNLPAWTAKEIEKNRRDAAELASRLNIE